MSFVDLFGSGEHLRNLGHFAAIVNLAAIDGEINAKEEIQLQRKLDIDESEYSKVLQNPSGFPISPPNTVERRLERIHDLFTIIFSDHEIDDEEANLIKKYAIGLGFSNQSADAIINRSIEIFSGKLSFEDYQFLLNRK